MPLLLSVFFICFCLLPCSLYMRFLHFPLIDTGWQQPDVPRFFIGPSEGGEPWVESRFPVSRFGGALSTRPPVAETDRQATSLKRGWAGSHMVCSLGAPSGAESAKSALISGTLHHGGTVALFSECQGSVL